MPASYSNSERLLLFNAIARLVAGGMCPKRACAQVGVRHPTWSSWRDKANATGGSLADGRRERSGRKPAFTLTEDEQSCLQQWVLKKEGSFAAGVEFFIDDARCLPATRAALVARLARARAAERPLAWPKSLRQHGQLPAGVMDLYHGPKAAQHAAPVGRYARTLRTAQGVDIPLTAGMAWTFDDYSANEPYQLDYADGKQRLCRQVLCGMDVATRGWLGFLHVGKEKDQYTSGDVLEVIRLCIEGQGHVPEVLILEQGRWKGNAVRGIELDGKGSRRWGSIAEAGIHLDYQYDSRGKTEVESGFHPLQRWLAGEGAGIGRVRGIMERESLDMVAINSGSLAKGGRDARACGFLTLEQSAEAHQRAMQALDDRPKHFRELGRTVSPNQLLSEQPFEKRPLLPQHRWLFYPVKSEATIREGGNVITSVDRREYVFRVNGILPGLHLPNGYRLLIAFDPERLELGCHIANRQDGSLNTGRHALGACLLPAAPHLTAAPRIDLSENGRGDDAGHKTYQGASKSARTAFRTILPGGKRGLRLDTIRNRQGDRVEMVIPGESETPVPPGPQTCNPPSPRPPKQRSHGRDPVITAPPRQTTLKTHANRKPDPCDEADLDAMEAAVLAGL